MPATAFELLLPSPADAPRSRRALVVDDDRQIRELFSIALRRVGFEVQVASGAAEALQRFSDARPDVVTLDLATPGVDGFSVIDRLHEIPDAPPIVIVSGMAQPTRDLPNVVAFIAKPLTLTALVAACELALDRSRLLRSPDVLGEAGS